MLPRQEVSSHCAGVPRRTMIASSPAPQGEVPTVAAVRDANQLIARCSRTTPRPQANPHVASDTCATRAALANGSAGRTLFASASYGHALSDR